jgi:isoleucyl-tRNA synthetase
MYDGATPVLDDEIINHVLDVLHTNGTDFWWSGTDADFSLGRPLTRGRDTLDVWFDSGSSWTLIDHADVYLEGSDQHRGWFQSSLLTKVGSTMRPEAPYTTCITHGFINDEKGNKMSKSEGNGISPVDMVKKYGADTCRLWAASVDYTQDVSVGVSALQNAEKVLKRWRNTMRFMSAYRAHGESVSLVRTTCQGVVLEVATQCSNGQLDRWILGETSRLQHQVLAYYDDFAFNRGVVAIQEFLPKLSTQYMEAVKDDLYCSAENDTYRQGAVATLTKVFDTLLHLLAPITPHLAEELHEHSEQSKSSLEGEIETVSASAQSVFLRPYTPLDYPTVDVPLLDLRARLKDMDVTPAKDVAIDRESPPVLS